MLRMPSPRPCRPRNLWVSSLARYCLSPWLFYPVFYRATAFSACRGLTRAIVESRCHRVIHEETRSFGGFHVLAVSF